MLRSSPIVHRLLGRNQLRSRLNDQLRTEPDFEAFCIDYFPDVHRRFARGMERTEKVNLLLQLVPDPGKILDKLGAYSADPRKSRRFLWGALSVAIAVIVALAAGIYGYWIRHSKPSSELTATLPRTVGAGLASSPVTPNDVNSDNAIDRSPDAEVHNQVRVPLKKPSARMNSGNRIQGSRGAKMYNHVTVTP